MKSLDVLLIEDNDADAQEVARLLAEMSTTTSVTRRTTLSDGLESIERNPPEVILLDLHLPDAVRLEGPTRLVAQYGSIPLLVVADQNDLSLALEAVEFGAQDYLYKDSIDADYLERAIRHAVARHGIKGELRESLRRAEFTNQEFEHFASAVAHDLRSPVRTARLLADRLTVGIQRGEGDPHDLAGRVGSMLEHLDNVLLSMLDYAVLRTNDRTSESSLLAPVIADVLAKAEADLAAVGGAVDVMVDPDLVVRGGEVLLFRVFENLLANSICYRDTARPLSVRLCAIPSGDRVTIVVQDNGVGIPVDKREQVFRMLEQLGDAAGKGLGLAVCRQIVHSLDGSIWVESTEEVGTKLVIDLPRQWSPHQILD